MGIEKEWFYETRLRTYRLDQVIRHPVPGMEIIFVLDGQAMIESGGILRRYSESDILLVTKSEQLRIAPIASGGDDCLLIVLQIAPRFLSFFFKDISPLFICDSTVGKQDFSALKSVISEIACHKMLVRENSAYAEENDLLFYSKLCRLLYELNQNFTAPREEAQENENAKREKAITDYINKNYHFPISLEETAANFSLSPEYFSRFFKKHFGVNFHKYLNDLRLESAKKDLILNDNTVTTIAYDNGFPNLNSFLKKLVDNTGYTPTEYRKTHRIKAQELEIALSCNEDTDEVPYLKEKLRPYIKDSGDLYQKEKLNIDMDINIYDGMAYKRPWEEVINLGFAHDLLQTAFCDQIKLIQKEAPFKYGRFQGLLMKNILTVNTQGEYSFNLVNRIIDFLYEVKLLPFIELSFKPYQITGRHGETVFLEKDESEGVTINEYEELIGKFMKHGANRYGLQEVNKWHFEIMATPSEGREEYYYSKAGLDSYVEQFIKINRVIKDIAPSALVGGPGFNLAIPEDLDMFVKPLHYLQGMDCQMDFFSFYAFSFSEIHRDRGSKGLVLWEKDENTKRINWAREFIQSVSSVKKIFVTEWNLDFSSRNRLHDSLIKAPFIIQNCIDAIDKVDILSYWLASDISLEYSDSNAILFGGAGLISRNSIRKPAFIAYNFLSRLGPVLLAKGDGYIVTEKTKNNFAIIMFNYKYVSNYYRLRKDYHDLSRESEEFLENNNNQTISLRLKNIQPGRYKLCSNILNTGYGSVYDAWKRLSTVEDLSNAEEAWLEKTCVPALQIDYLDVKEGDLLIEYDFEPNEVRFLEISIILK